MSAPSAQKPIQPGQLPARASLPFESEVLESLNLGQASLYLNRNNHERKKIYKEKNEDHAVAAPLKRGGGFQRAKKAKDGYHQYNYHSHVPQHGTPRVFSQHMKRGLECRNVSLSKYRSASAESNSEPKEYSCYLNYSKPYTMKLEVSLSINRLGQES
jgi:hypothetical protein